MLVRSVPQGTRNGLPERGAWYVYRGSGVDTLTPRLSPQAPRRKRGAPTPATGAGASPSGRCLSCGYKAAGRNCRGICGRPS